MTLDWLLSLAAWVPLPWLALIAGRCQGHWLAPGPLAAWAWAVAAGLPLFLAPDLPVHPQAYGLVLLFVTVCVIASTVGASVVEFRPGPVIDERPWRAAAWRLCWIGVVLGCFGAVLLYEHTREFTRGASLSEIAMYASMARYEGDYSIPLPVRMLTCVTYFVAALSAFLTASTPPEQRRWKRALAWLVPLAVAMLVHTSKATVLYGLVLWAAGWTAGTAFSNDAARRRSARWILHVVLAVSVLAAALLCAQALRMNRTSVADIPFLLDHLRIYVVGHMPVFGHWVEVEMPASTGEDLGVRTFAGVAELAGVAERKSGLYDGTADFTESNIYTAWRPLIEDFGVLGATSFLFAIAFAAGAGWRLLAARRLSGAAIVIAFAAYVIWSPITSIFVYSMILAVVVMFAIWTWWAARAGRLQGRIATLTSGS